MLIFIFNFACLLTFIIFIWHVIFRARVYYIGIVDFQFQFHYDFHFLKLIWKLMRNQIYQIYQLGISGLR